MSKVNSGQFLLFLGLLFLSVTLLIGYSSVKVVYDTASAGLVNNETGGIDVNLQDQTTRPVDIRINQILDDTTYSLSVTPTIDQYDLTLNTVSGLSVGDNIAFLEQNGMPQLFFGVILGISGNVVTMDGPVPYNFTPSATAVFTFNNDLTVDGSTNTEVFSIINLFDEAIDIVRFNFHCTDNVEMHDGLFCGDDELERGILLRKYTLDGYYINYWNIKNNGQWTELAFDTSYSDKGKPPDDTYGFASRLTYGGSSKHGVVIRLNPGERIELLVQDDLTSISNGNLMVEGHFVQN